jgi:hypothetical protein
MTLTDHRSWRCQSVCLRSSRTVMMATSPTTEEVRSEIQSRSRVMAEVDGTVMTVRGSLLDTITNTRPLDSILPIGTEVGSSLASIVDSVVGCQLFSLSQETCARARSTGTEFQIRQVRSSRISDLWLRVVEDRTFLPLSFYLLEYACLSYKPIISHFLIV